MGGTKQSTELISAKKAIKNNVENNIFLEKKVDFFPQLKIHKNDSPHAGILQDGSRQLAVILQTLIALRHRLSPALLLSFLFVLF